MESTQADRKTEHRILERIKKALGDRLFTGIEILCARGNHIVFHHSYGTMDQQTESPPLQNGSLFDLASLTKPLATAAAICHLSDAGLLELNDCATRLIPEFKNTEKSEITISQLLTHSAGFNDWLPLYEPRFDQDTAWQKLIQTPLAYVPGSSVIYSCLGYIVLAEIVRRVAGQSLAQYCRSKLYRPLDLKNLMFNPDTRRTDIVSTAYCPLRGKRLRGIVHDENAFAFGGEGGNAGLFGTAADIHAYCMMLLSSGRMKGKRIFSDTAVDGFLRNQNTPSIPARTYGWDINDGSDTDMSCGNLMPIGSIGHLGFTGTSIWMDPVSQIIIILLSNRVNLSREGTIPLMRVFRPEMHTLLLPMVLD